MKTEKYNATVSPTFPTSVKNTNMVTVCYMQSLLIRIADSLGVPKESS